MFQRYEHSFGTAGTAANLSLDAALRPAAAAAPDRLAEFTREWRARLARIDPAPDLGARIGSREWFRGAATCLALCYTAILLGPRFEPLVGANEVPLSSAQFEEVRALAFSPLAYGSDTGRRMAPTDAVEPLTDTPERPSIELTATLGQGDGFARVLERAGVGDGEAQRIAAMVSGAVALDAIKPGTAMEVHLGRRPSRNVARPLDGLLFRAAFDLKLAIERSAGALRLRRIPIAVDNTPLRIRGRVGASLYQSARASGVPGKAIETYLRALGQHLDVGSDVHASDRFDLILEHRRAATGEVETGQLLYGGLDQGKRQTRLLKWTTGSRTQWFEASGVGETHGSMKAPVDSTRITSTFGMRMHPLLGFSRMHKGVDYGAPAGAPIYAVTDGVVGYSGWHGGHGNYVLLKHAGNMMTGYAHMSRILARVGMHVSQGQVIGYVGSTGLSTGPHLHFEVYRNGEAVNPATVTFASTAQLAGAELARFRARLASLLTVGTKAAAAPKSQSAQATKPKTKA